MAMAIVQSDDSYKLMTPGHALLVVKRKDGMADYPVAKVNDIEEGRTLRVVVDGIEVLLCKCEGGAIYAIEDVCTHDGAPLDQGELQGCEITCARHGAVFDVRSGAVLALPAVMPVPAYKVRIEGDDVFVDV
jgi:3-phenylpropionate/trans-cinnamate dioxygenase ferredoxin subunit